MRATEEIEVVCNGWACADYSVARFETAFLARAMWLMQLYRLHGRLLGIPKGCALLILETGGWKYLRCTYDYT